MVLLGQFRKLLTQKEAAMAIDSRQTQLFPHTVALTVWGIKCFDASIGLLAELYAGIDAFILREER